MSLIIAFTLGFISGSCVVVSIGAIIWFRATYKRFAKFEKALENVKVEIVD